MSDLVKRLRQWNIAENATRTTHSIMRDLNDAADEIERLQEVHKRDLAEYNRVAADVTRLRAALERIDIETCDEYAREMVREALKDE